MSAEANKQLIERFYSAFGQKDGHAMAECYAPDVHFSDPVFPDLSGPRAGAMWDMLTQAPGDLRIELLDHDADEKHGSAQWRAHYVFSQTGRPVVKAVERAAHADPMAVGPTESDLTVIWHGPGLGMSHPSLGTIGPVPFRRPGGHTGPLGVVFVAADGVTPGMRGLRSSFDIAPTIVDLLGQPSAPISGTIVLA